MIKVLFFARYREQLGCSELQLGEEAGNTVSSLRQLLSDKGENWAEVMRHPTTLVAINQTVVSDDASITAGDEVAFFPPVTGG
ncbi:molybdopterin converting factor subunit 1 [Endozoicomonadaceae bacterium StTr2]